MSTSHFGGIRLFTLLYIDEAEIQHCSVGKGQLSFKDVYIKCASNLLASCISTGVRVEILTNQPVYVNAQLKSLGAQEIAVDAAFARDVPKGIPFYAAHFKLDVISQLSSGQFGDFVGLVDSDVIMLKPPLVDLKTWADNQLFVYDISNSVNEEYGELVHSDLRRVADRNLLSTRWFGGEFIAGSASAFGTLSKRLDIIWPSYKQLVNELHHVGDEMIVSAALNSLADDEAIIITNVGDEQHRWISRWFSTRARFSQRTLSYHLDSSMLHLPADKRFIADFHSNPFELGLFIQKYEKHVRRKLVIRKLLNNFSILKRGRLRQVPNLK